VFLHEKVGLRRTLYQKKYCAGLDLCTGGAVYLCTRSAKS